jgi:acetyltransferase
MGCDCVSASGATMVFIVEMAMQLGITFSSIFSVGNSAQIGVEDVLEYWDESFDPKTSSKLKLLYMEQVQNPQKLLKHARSLVNKGCSLAGIKAGTTEAGSRAVSSHTGALAGSDTATDALLRKAGIVRCTSREELVYVIGAMNNKTLKGDRIAVITHAGGPGVMLTDALSKGGMKVPKLSGASSDKLLEQLYHGSSVANPIDFLATGTAEQLGLILDTIENEFDNIDGSVVIFGTTGMFDVTTVYDTINEKMKSCSKPIYPVMPSVIQASREMDHFKGLGRIAFTDEVALGNALCKINSTNKPFSEESSALKQIDEIRKIIDGAKDGSYLTPVDVQNLLDLAGIARVPEAVVLTKEDAIAKTIAMGFPVVMKVVGPLHKSDVGGVVLSVQNEEEVAIHFVDLMKIDNASGVLIQKMIKGQEIYIGAKREESFGHLILCGLGGIFIEVLKDVSYGLAPIGKEEALTMIKSIKAYGLIKGVRGREGVNVDLFADAIVNLSLLLEVAPEIAEMDINPLLGTMQSVTAVDARILIKK